MSFANHFARLCNGQQVNWLNRQGRSLTWEESAVSTVVSTWVESTKTSRHIKSHIKWWNHIQRYSECIREKTLNSVRHRELSFQLGAFSSGRRFFWQTKSGRRRAGDAGHSARRSCHGQGAQDPSHLSLSVCLSTYLSGFIWIYLAISIYPT